MSSQVFDREVEKMIEENDVSDEELLLLALLIKESLSDIQNGQ